MEKIICVECGKEEESPTMIKPYICDKCYHREIEIDEQYKRDNDLEKELDWEFDWGQEYGFKNHNTVIEWPLKKS